MSDLRIYLAGYEATLVTKTRFVSDVSNTLSQRCDVYHNLT